MKKDNSNRVNRFCQAFCLIVVLLGWGKEIMKIPSSTLPHVEEDLKDGFEGSDSLVSKDFKVAKVAKDSKGPNDSNAPNNFPHKIYSVPSFKTAFPDQNDVQLIAAEKNGIKPLALRSDVEKNHDKLVYIGSNPYFYVERMKQGAPYLVPKAALLVEDIGRIFLDSLQVKGIPLHKIIITSALRTNEDIGHLQRRNLNSVQNSCHSYATTVDIAYNRYKTVESPDGPARREVQNDSLKWVLSEVLNDFRQQERCYVKYEVKQGCFHLTVR